MAEDIDTSHYATGTATVANGSVNVVGQGTTWLSVRKGDMFGTHVGDGIRILEIVDETHLTLAHNWTGPSQTTAIYEIQRTPYDIGYLQRLEELIELLNSGNLEAFAALVGAPDLFPMFTGSGTLTLVSKAELISGIDVDAKVETLPDRAAYDDQIAGFTVTVNNVGDGRAAFYYKKSNASADWSTAAYLTGPVGPAPIITASVTPTAPGTAPDVNTSPIMGGYALEFELPLARGSGFQYEFATATADADPGAGNWRANNAAFGSATQLFISKTTDLGVALAAFLAAMGTSTSPNKGTIVFQRLSDGVTASWAVSGVTDATGYVKVAVSGYSGPSVFAASDLTMLQFTRTGDKGADGSGTVTTIVAGRNINVDLSTPTAPVISSIVVPPPQGRLSLTSGTPLPLNDVATATTIYYVAASGKIVPIYDGTAFVVRDFGAQISCALDSNTGHTQYQIANNNYDLWAIWDSGQVRLGTGPKWVDGSIAGSDVSRGGGIANTTELELFNGFLVNKNQLQIRYGSGSGDIVTVPARQATLLGTFRATANGQATDTETRRLLSNAYNQSSRKWREVIDTAASWSYSIAAMRLANNNAATKAEMLFSLGVNALAVRMLTQVDSSTATFRVVGSGIYVDASLEAQFYFNVNNTEVRKPYMYLDKVVSEGFHTVQIGEYGAGADTQTWIGNTQRMSGFIFN